jgi:hypothetical protein
VGNEEITEGVSVIAKNAVFKYDYQTEETFLGS